MPRGKEGGNFNKNDEGKVREERGMLGAYAMPEKVGTLAIAEVAIDGDR